ncbi:RNA polymerase sigma factor [Aureispira anguillae]|uniref:Sigma-70 family RNA polymerase sigma factor n=1 Tax=Aureispira anguillae TaxID=2864201 RepID=A0A915YF62_9BACT|nr:sigma-70 family RNA polymerase sigma factor [Aureispira anguillae]BDS11998.1 sigma-70 family RNA polymerase sigma factor [Aureispira anguillae]
MNKKLSDRALEDFELVRKAVDANNQLAYAELMERYRDSIYHTMFKMVHNHDDAEDLTIEAFGKAFRKLHTYTPNYAFSTWLFKIATNNGIDFLRKKRLKLLSIDDPLEKDGEQDFSNNLKSSALDPEERYIRQQRKLIMRTLLNKLSDKYRIMIELRFFEELSYQEIAEQLNLPIGTVKAQLFRAKELLYDVLKKSKAGNAL